MFGFLKKSNDVDVYSPVNGTMLSIADVPDRVFADKLIGDGCAFRDYGNIIYAPCNGEIIMIPKTKHAIGMKANNGAEILLHVGLDTVNLNGEGFDVLVREHQKVKRGCPLIKLDLDVMKKNFIDLTMPMVITNGSEFHMIKIDTQAELENVVLKLNRI